jgi:hypothetical protein
MFVLVYTWAPMASSQAAGMSLSSAAVGVCGVYRSGSGGDGEIVEAGRGKWVANLKYHAGANQPKKIWLPASKPPHAPMRCHAAARAVLIAHVL